MDNLTFQQYIKTTFSALKIGRKAHVPRQILATLPSGKNIQLDAVTKKMLQKKAVLQMLAHWRAKHIYWFAEQSTITLASTKKWARKHLVERSDRILFFMSLMGSKEPFGHMGLYRFDFTEKSCEVDNIVRGKVISSTKGAMTVGLEKLIHWTYKYLGVKKIYLRVFSDNRRAIDLYQRVGFIEVEQIPMFAKRENASVFWLKAKTKAEKKQATRYFVRMKYFVKDR